MTDVDLPDPSSRSPRRPNDLVVRERLHAALSAGVAGPLTLVSAPPGAGKTVMVASWVSAVARRRARSAWASLDQGDADRHRFWRLVAAAPDLGIGVPRRGDLSATLDGLCHALSKREEPVVLVLDDFHEVTGCEVAADLDRLLAQAPPALRLVLVTRQDPPLRLPRLRLTDGLSEIRQSHLAFSEHEAAALLRQAGATLDAHEISMLCRRTEGWAAALRLSALSLRDHPEPEAHVAALAASDRTVADYLLGELLDRQPADLRAFLLRTSIVDALTGDLADALTEGDDGAARLGDLVRRNAMVTPLGGPGGWFTYHPLLRELLRAELGAQRGGERRTLHRRAASWLAAHGREREALRHARAAPMTPISWRASSAIAGPSSSSTVSSAPSAIWSTASPPSALPRTRRSPSPGWRRTWPSAGSAVPRSSSGSRRPRCRATRARGMRCSMPPRGCTTAVCGAPTSRPSCRRCVGSPERPTTTPRSRHSRSSSWA